MKLKPKRRQKLFNPKFMLLGAKTYHAITLFFFYIFVYTGYNIRQSNQMQRFKKIFFILKKDILSCALKDSQTISLASLK